MDNNIKDLDIVEIFNDVINLKTLIPNSYPITFDLDSLKELFEFLLQFFTMLSKRLYGDDKGQVDLSTLSQTDFETINNYMLCIGFSCHLQILSATSHNLLQSSNNRYDRIPITTQTNLQDLTFGLKCQQMLYIINFDTYSNYNNTQQQLF